MITSVAALLVSTTTRGDDLVPCSEVQLNNCQEELAYCDAAFEAMEIRYNAAEQLIRDQAMELEQQAEMLSSDNTDWLTWGLIGIILGGVAGSQL